MDARKEYQFLNPETVEWWSVKKTDGREPVATEGVIEEVSWRKNLESDIDLEMEQFFKYCFSAYALFHGFPLDEVFNGRKSTVQVDREKLLGYAKR